MKIGTSARRSPFLRIASRELIKHINHETANFDKNARDNQPHLAERRNKEKEQQSRSSGFLGERFNSMHAYIPFFQDLQVLQPMCSP
jgi:hypothetical protein